MKVVKLQTTKIIVDFVFQRAVPKLLVFLPVFYLHLQIWNIGRGTGEANIACCFANYFENTEDTVISRAVTNEPFNNSVICDMKFPRPVLEILKTWENLARHFGTARRNRRFVLYKRINLEPLASTRMHVHSII